MRRGNAETLIGHVCVEKMLLHVSALAGHLQAEYTIVLGSYFTHKGSVVLCY
jgi:hypothetical protein